MERTDQRVGSAVCSLETHIAYRKMLYSWNLMSEFGDTWTVSPSRNPPTASQYISARSWPFCLHSASCIRTHTHTHT